MYIKTKSGVKLHWWGRNILLCVPGFGYYLMDETESYFVEQMCNCNELNELTSNISFSLGIGFDEAVRFIHTFCQNFDIAIEINPIKSQINLSGKKGYYYPVLIHISLTSDCPQRCIHCYKNAGENIKEISYYELEVFLNNMKGLVPEIILSGGEPLLYSKINDLIIRYSDFFNIGVFTSGYISIIDNPTIKYANLGVTVSLYSSKPEIHDRFTKTSESYKRVIETIRYAVNQGISVNINTLITRNNEKDIEQLIGQLETMGVESVSLGRITSVGRAIRITDNKWFCDMGDYMSICARLKKVSHIVNIEDDKTESLNLPLGMFHCTAGTLSWSVDEDGCIFPCGMYTDSIYCIGHLNHFSDLICSDRAATCSRLRDYVKYNPHITDNCPLKVI